MVGHEEAKRAVILALINPGLNLLLWGDEGLGKKTLLMAISEFLPEIASTGCHFNCNPRNRNMMCSDCLKGGWKVHNMRAPLVILPYNIRRTALIGTDANPRSIIGAANRGTLLIRNMENYDRNTMSMIFYSQKERKVKLGDFSYPSFFQVAATYNGDPGIAGEEFSLKVHVKEITDVEERIEIARRVEWFRRDPKGFAMLYDAEERKLAGILEESRIRLRKVSVPARVSRAIKHMMEEFGLKKDYERRMMMASAANAAYEGRMEVTDEDVDDVKDFVLPFLHG